MVASCRKKEVTVSERRIAGRQAAGVAAKAIFAQGTKECTVIDFSDTGARVRLIGFTALPDQFELYIPERKTSVSCTVQWRLNDELGVLFDARSGNAVPPSDSGLLSRIDRLEAAVAQLQRLLLEGDGRLTSVAR
jgi:hypothetical protein